MRDYGGRLTFDPHLPRQLRKLRFPLEIQGQELVVEMGENTATYLLRKGAGLTIVHEGEEVLLRTGESVILPINKGASEE
jgi:alpha,alpha-trehalose phosphorylase